MKRVFCTSRVTLFIFAIIDDEKGFLGFWGFGVVVCENDGMKKICGASVKSDEES